MAELTVAVVGCGGMGGVHLSRWSQVSGAHVAAVCDLDAANAMRAATEFGAEAHTDWAGMIRGGGYTVIDICTPPNLHSPIASLALEHGAHVLCETPMGRNAEEARTIAAKAEEAGRMVMPGFCHRFHPPVFFARELIDNDDLGRIIMFRSRLSDLLLAVENRWVSDRDVAGAGVLTDVTVHQVDLFRYLVGEVKSAAGRVSTIKPHLRVPDSAVMTLQAENGALGVVESSWSTLGGQNALELYGTAGACLVDYDTGRVRFRTADMAVWETREVGGPDRFQREIGQFADAVRGIQPPAITAADGLRALEIIGQIAGQR